VTQASFGASPAANWTADSGDHGQLRAAEEFRKGCVKQQMLYAATGISTIAIPRVDPTAFVAIQTRYDPSQMFPAPPSSRPSGT
jgi:hypothetical protein